MTATGRFSKKQGRQVSLWLPQDIMPSLKKAVHLRDTDMQKLIREAVREKVDRVMREHQKRGISN